MVKIKELQYIINHLKSIIENRWKYYLECKDQDKLNSILLTIENILSVTNTDYRIVSSNNQIVIEDDILIEFKIVNKLKGNSGFDFYFYDSSIDLKEYY